MENLKDLYILGQPIKTPIGNLRFVKVKEYPQMMEFYNELTLDKNDILVHLDKEAKEYCMGVPFIDIIKNTNFLIGFKNMFIFFFNEDVFELIKTDEELEYYRQLIKNMNVLSFKKPNPNPEIARFDRMEALLKKKRGEEVTFESMYTCIWLGIGQRPDELTFYEFYSLFNRLTQFKNFDMTTLYATVSNEVRVDPWYKHIEILQNKKEATSLSDFSKNIQGILSL